MQTTDTAQITPLTPRQNLPDAPVASCRYGGGRFEPSETGVYFLGKDKDGNEQPPQWICAPLHVIAKTRDEKSGEWGRLLEWQDDDNHIHQWAMPLELLESDGSDVRRELARLGLHISPNQSARGLLAAYIKVWAIEARARCVDRLGWHDNTFVTPSGSIGQAEELVVFQNSHAIEPAYCESGTADEWRALSQLWHKEIRGLYLRFLRLLQALWLKLRVKTPAAFIYAALHLLANLPH